MKKLFKGILAICLVFMFSFAFFGCQEDTDFYIKTNEKFETFVTNICENEKYENGIQYGKNLTSILSKIDNDSTFNASTNSDALMNYTQIPDVYDKIFTSSFKFLNEFQGVFKLKPSKLDKSVKKEYESFEKKLDLATTSIERLSDYIVSVDVSIGGDSLDNAIDPISIQAIKNYKREYIKTTNKIIDVCDNFLTIVGKYIYPKYDSYMKDGNYIELSSVQLDNEKDLALLKSSITTLKCSIKYLNMFNGEYKLLSNDKFVDVLESYVDIELSTSNTLTTQKLQLWLNNYNAFLGNKSNFEYALSKIDYDKLVRIYNFDYNKYLENNLDQKSYVDNVNDFINSSIYNLFNSVKSLIE